MKNVNVIANTDSPKFTFKRDARFTRQEEIANTVSHGIGTVFSVVALILLVIFAAKRGDAWHVVSFSIFGTSMLMLYISSTFTHALPLGRLKDIFHNADQIAIYILIAGTYTPFALSVLRHDWGWVMFGIEWGLAFGGIMLKMLMPNTFERGVNIIIIISYLLMGWLLLFFLVPLFKHMGPTGIGLIFLGGAFYTFGIIFFKMEKVKYGHLIWHLMVMAGSVSHWLAIMFYAL
ncbi:MAG: hemolysin III family protein [Candidatus Marinimicrobia bacterium]|nr:hemolysin III family protein [Candidatus Neomarinimicrobiota bacterium]